jgi:hypothetical protein
MSDLSTREKAKMLAPIKKTARKVGKGVGLCQEYGCEVCDETDAT